MFLGGAMIPLVGGAVLIFAPAPLLGYAVGLRHSLIRIGLAVGISAALVTVGGGLSAAAVYLLCFGVAAISICFMLERRQPFELIVLSTTILMLAAGIIAALAVAGSPGGVVQLARDQLISGITRGENFYKALGVESSIAPNTRAYIVDMLIKLMPSMVALFGAIVVLLNLAVFWRWSGREQRIGYTLFGDLARWSTPEWLIWPLLVSGFAWFIPQQTVATVALDFFVCIVAVYFAQGLAIMAFYFKQLKMPAVARGLIYFVTVAQPVLTAIVGAAGVFDLWVDFRRLKRPDVAAGDLGNFS